MLSAISLKATIISLIESIDLFNYILKSHHRRVAIISYALGLHYGLSDVNMRNLVLAASLHDIGALNVDDQAQLTEIDVKNPRKHEIIGSAMLSNFEPFTEIAHIIYHHHIKWSQVSIDFDIDEVPIECYFLHLADRIDVLIDASKPILLQIPNIINKIDTLGEEVFAPFVLKTFHSLAVQDTFWLDIDHTSFDLILSELIDDPVDFLLSEESLEQLALIFSRIVDFRSHFTATHSIGVGCVAYELAMLMNLSPETTQELKIAGYLHDIGKIGVPSELIEKKGSLTESEYNEIKLHSYYTYSILSKIRGFENICNWASKHHEKHDSSGYPFHISKNDFTIEIDILAFADIFTSLCEDRPYRAGINKNEVLAILETFVPELLDISVYEVIKNNFEYLNRIRESNQINTEHFYTEIMNRIN